MPRDSGSRTRLRRLRLLLPPDSNTDAPSINLPWRVPFLSRRVEESTVIGAGKDIIQPGVHLLALERMVGLRLSGGELANRIHNKVVLPISALVLPLELVTRDSQRKRGPAMLPTINGNRCDVLGSGRFIGTRTSRPGGGLLYRRQEA